MSMKGTIELERHWCKFRSLTDGVMLATYFDIGYNEVMYNRPLPDSAGSKLNLV